MIDFTVAKTPILAASSCSHIRICVHVGTSLSAMLYCDCNMSW